MASRTKLLTVPGLTVVTRNLYEFRDCEVTVSRRIRRRTTTLPVASRPTTLQLFLPRSIPRTDTFVTLAPSSNDPLSRDNNGSV